MTTTGDAWVPQACTLPTVERPVRRAAFDELFAHEVLGVRQESPHRLLLDLRPEPAAASRAADLAVRETGCCSFFSFELAVADGRVRLAVATAPEHADVLAALGARAQARARAAS